MMATMMSKHFVMMKRDDDEDVLITIYPNPLQDFFTLFTFVQIDGCLVEFVVSVNSIEYKQTKT